MRISSIFRNTAHKRHISHIVTGLCSAFFFLFAAVSSADLVPTAEDINKLAETAKLTTDTFMEESFQLRMGYEYSGKFLIQNDKENLHKLAKRASDRLLAIANTKRQLKQQIEDYQGPDWDDRYGVSGLWRELFAELYTTTSSKCEIDFYLALTADQPQRNEILHQILDQIDSLYQAYPSDNLKLLKAKILAMLALSEPVYKPLAIEQLDLLCKPEADVPDAVYFRAVIEKIKLAGQTKPDQLDSLAEELARSSCAGDFELILSLAFLRRQLNYPEALEKIVRLWPQTEDFLGSLILSQLLCAIESGQLNKLTLQQISVFEAELAVQTAWKKEAGDPKRNKGRSGTPKDHKMLLDYLSSTEKFQTPLILYVAAIAFADSSPIKAVNLLVNASSLQQLQKSDRLETSACKIAKQAAQLAYNLFAEDLLNCRLALKAFENYSTMASEKIDEETEYLYSIVLDDCGEGEKAKNLLQKIANRPTGAWRDRAKLDLIVQELQQTQGKGQSRQNELVEQLNDFILNCKGQDKNSNRLRMEAITTYCQTLLESRDKLSAQKVLAVLDKVETTGGIRFDLFKSKALQQLGRLEESVHHMVLATRPDSGSLAWVVMELLSEVVDRIDHLELQADDFNKMIQDCKNLAEFSNKCLNDPRTALLLVEISIFAANKEKEKLSTAEKLLGTMARDVDTEDVALLRCRARLLTEQNKFGEAAGLWAQVAEMRKNESPPAKQRSWKWWRAKFYELDCWAKLPQTEKMSVLHTIEVLENSFPDIPLLWAEKFNLLKQQCRNQLIETSK